MARNDTNRNDPWDPEAFKSRLSRESKFTKQLGAAVAVGYVATGAGLLAVGYDPIAVLMPVLLIPYIVIAFGLRF